MRAIKKSKVFLGGTCNGSTWRDVVKEKLMVDYFDPVVDDWTPEAQKEEERQKEELCDIHLYVITKKMKGVFSIAEVIDSVHDKTKKTFLQVVPEGFEEFQIKSLNAVADLVTKRGGFVIIDNDVKKIAQEINVEALMF